MTPPLFALRCLTWSVVIASLAAIGCGSRSVEHRGSSPTQAGLHTNDLIDPVAQARSEQAIAIGDLTKVAERARERNRPAHLPPKRTALVLSGGGAYGAYSAGVIYGWTCRGDRPTFDVVTGISTGALIAPLVFLGPKYDGQVREFYTSIESRDIFNIQAVRGLVSESLADNAPLARQIDRVLTPEIVAELAAEHQKGRRLYIGTTELEARRFVVWDIGEIASRNCPNDVELIKQILLGSSAIPGFFPASRIEVTVDGRRFVERHVDGGVSQGLFFRPPYIPPHQLQQPDGHSLYGTDVYIIVAGKMYTDPEEIKPRSLTIAGKSVSAMTYSQTRGDLVRLWTMCMLMGMNYHLTAIPQEYPASKDSTEFKPEVLTALFNEGVRQIQSGTTWRTSPPGVEPSESVLERAGTRLMHLPRTPQPPGDFTSAPPTYWPLSEFGIPASPMPIVK